MNIIYDNDSAIAKFKLYEYFGTVFDSAIRKNGDGEAIFYKSGISSLINEYQTIMTPFHYNGQWQNPNPQYNPQRTVVEVFPKLDEKHKFLFIKSIVENANFYQINQERLSNHLAVLGYSLTDSDESKSKYTICQTSKGMAERASDVVLLEKRIKSDYPTLYYIYDEALSTFGNAEYKSCIDNCRTLYEKITSALTGDSTDKAALSLSGESIVDGAGIQLTSKDKIFKYWIDKKKGANRYRYFTTLYSVMSGLGTHGEEEPTKADAIMILRALEDVLVWMLKI